MLCVPFLFAIDRRDCSLRFGKLIIAYVLVNYLAIRINMQGGSAWLSFNCSLNTSRGGTTGSNKGNIRSAYRNDKNRKATPSNDGFHLAHDI